MKAQPFLWSTLGVAGLALLLAQPAMAEGPTLPNMSGSVQKREFADSVPLLSEIQQLAWKENEGKKIGLHEVLDRTLEHDVRIRQARIELKAAKKQPPVLPNVLTLLNPLDLANLKQASDANIEAANFHEQSITQKALLDNARLYAALNDAWLNRHLAYQAMEQAKRQLKTAQERFFSGEANRFEVTKTEIALIDAYRKTLEANNLYIAASSALATALELDSEQLLLPEDATLKEGESPRPLTLLTANPNPREAVAAAIENRPDLRELNARHKALEKLADGSPRTEALQHKAEADILELKLDQATLAAKAAVQKALADYRLAWQSLDMANQQLKLAEQFVHQLEVSQEAGFSSTQDVLDGQLELSRARASQVRAILQHNLAQMQLLAEMGVLRAL